MAAASIVINQGALSVGVPSQSRDDLAVGTLVQLSNADNSGVRSWRWTLIARPTSSTATLSSPVDSNPTFTPDVVGSYLVQLLVNEGAAGQSDTRLAIVRDANGLRVPAFRESDQANYPLADGSLNAEGYEPDLSALLELVRSQLGEGRFPKRRPMQFTEVFWEFLQYDETANGWVGTFNGATVAVGGAATEDDQHPGIIDLNVTGNSSGNYAGYRTSVTQQSAGGGAVVLEYMMRLAAVPDPTDDFSVMNGFRDVNTGNPTDGIVLFCDSNSANWQLQVYDPAVNSVDTGIPVETGWQRHRITVNEDATLVSCEIETAASGTQISSNTITSGIPAATDTFGIGFNISWVAGTPTALMSLDYVWFYQEFAGGSRLAP